MLAAGDGRIKRLMKQLTIIILTILFVNMWSTLSAATPQACKFVSEGAVQQTWKKIRIQSGADEILAGADNFSEAVNIAQELVSSGTCTAKSQECRLSSEGIVAGLWVKHRIRIDGEMVFGADDMATSLNQLTELRRLGFCR